MVRLRMRGREQPNAVPVNPLQDSVPVKEEDAADDDDDLGAAQSLPPPLTSAPSPEPAIPVRERRKPQKATATLGASARIAQLRAETGLGPNGAADSTTASPGTATAATSSAEDADAAKATAANAAPEATAAEEENTGAMLNLDAISSFFDAVFDSMTLDFCFLAVLLAIAIFLVMHLVRQRMRTPEEVLADEQRTTINPGQLVGMLWSFAEDNPEIYLGANFGIAFIFGAFFLFLKDIQDWLIAQNAASQARRGYQVLGDVEAAVASANDQSPEELAKELRRVTDQAEELEIKVKAYKKSSTDYAMEAKNRLRSLTSRRDELYSILHGSSAKDEDGGDAKKGSGSSGAKPSLVATVFASSFMQGVIRTFNGLMTVTLYFADVVSDVQVLQLLISTSNKLWAFISGFMLVFQFFVVWVRVLPYLRSTFGANGNIYWGFVLFGFPFGLIGLDMLMFLEPFGLLTVLPLPAWLRQFIPACMHAAAQTLISRLPPHCPTCASVPLTSPMFASHLE